MEKNALAHLQPQFQWNLHDGTSKTTRRPAARLPSLISLHVFEDDTVAKVTVSKANLNVFCVFVGPCPVFCCFAVLLCGETQIWLGDLRVVFGCGGCVVFVFLVFRDDLLKFLDHTCPCTFLLFTAYAIVRTEPSANRPNRRKKKEGRCQQGPSTWGKVITHTGYPLHVGSHRS